jgi:hypothetical protein
MLPDCAPQQQELLHQFGWQFTDSPGAARTAACQHELRQDD